MPLVPPVTSTDWPVKLKDATEDIVSSMARKPIQWRTTSMATKSKAKSKSPASVPTVKLFKVFEGVQAGDIPAYQPGEMILRLTPASQVPPTPANPLGLRVKVLEFLSELTQYGLWRIEPLVQLERRVWETNVVGSPTVDGPPPVVPMALMPPALGPLMQGLYRYLQFGDNASLQQDAVRAGDQWVPVVTVPTRARACRWRCSRRYGGD